MLAGAGRPRKACGQCKSQKVRCSGEKPVCRRCQRLKHRCSYDAVVAASASSISKSRDPRHSSSKPSNPLLHQKKTPATDRAESNASSVSNSIHEPFQHQHHRRTPQATKAGPHFDPQLPSPALTATVAPPPLPLQHSLGGAWTRSYLGIPPSLLETLVEVYYQNVYNASLLLHKRLFLESLAAGTARPHVVLSVCAWASM